MRVKAGDKLVVTKDAQVVKWERNARLRIPRWTAAKKGTPRKEWPHAALALHE